jgi:hypothetical protein
MFKAMDRKFVVSCLAAFALGVALTLGAVAVYPDNKTASSATRHKWQSGGTRSISWTAARRKLGRCKVTAVQETHSRLVTLTLRRGRTFTTVEPAFGDIVHELARVRSTCGQITLSTS